MLRMARTPRKRLDEILLARELAESRSQAQGLILAGKVRHGTQRLDKPGKSFPADIALELERPPRFVSRGGEKLEGFFEAFPVVVTGSNAVDIGASTGGFTDCLLQRGAASVTCVDVGRAQLHHRILQDPRVTNLEKVNARHLVPGQLPRPGYDLAVMDLSFISLRKVLPAVWPYVVAGGVLVALIKPQFEATRTEVDRGSGVIRDPAIHARVRDGIRDFVRSELSGSVEIGWIRSPLAGGDGNIEFLCGWQRRDNPVA